ncbi:helix-turn-helix domain-containing protein [Streptomyces sp. NPDC085942]|uniref:helix-turn-helix domain-containing protein n=1 Tax=Streptomyces sp. NPDC085942 TaxID=3365743 RepID=UPI0037D63C77
MGTTQARQRVAERRLPVNQRAIEIEKYEAGHVYAPYLPRRIDRCIVTRVKESPVDPVEALLARPTLPSPEVRAALRQAEGLTQLEVATALGVTRVAFHRWETGQAEPRTRSRNAYLDLLQRLAKKHPQIGLEGSSA